MSAINDFIKAIDFQLKQHQENIEKDKARRTMKEMKGVDLTKCKDCGTPLDEKTKCSVASSEGVFYICENCSRSCM